MAPYVKETRDRFQMRLSREERDMINFIMKCEDIPCAAKAIRYCIAEKAAELQRKQRKAGNAK